MYSITAAGHMIQYRKTNELQVFTAQNFLSSDCKRFHSWIRRVHTLEMNLRMNVEKLKLYLESISLNQVRKYHTRGESFMINIIQERNMSFYIDSYQSHPKQRDTQRVRTNPVHYKAHSMPLVHRLVLHSVSKHNYPNRTQ